MIAAWRKLDQVAAANDQLPLKPEVWEVALKDGTVAAIVRSNIEAHAVVNAHEPRQDRKLAVYSLEEIGRLLDDYRRITEAKLTFPGATVTAIRRPGADPLNAVLDTAPGLDDLMDDEMPSFGGQDEQA